MNLFYLLTPALIINFIETSIDSKEKIHKKSLANNVFIQVHLFL